MQDKRFYGTFQLRLDAETQAALAALAEATDRSRANVVRWLVRREARKLITGNKIKAQSENTTSG